MGWRGLPRCRRAGTGFAAASTVDSMTQTALVPNLEEVTGYMAANKKQTGVKAASAASRVLTGPKSTKAEKKAAASALSQTPSKGKK
jgi:hypothetical protein